MVSKKDSNKARLKRHKRVRAKISGTGERPRLCVYRSNQNISAQVIDDVTGVTLVSASTLEAGFEGNGSNKEAAKKVEDGIEETLTYCDFPSEHWTRIRTNNVMERLNREIRRRTRVVGSFPDGNSALMLVCARLRHVAGSQWGNKKYLNMKHLEAALEDASIAG